MPAGPTFSVHRHTRMPSEVPCRPRAGAPVRPTAGSTPVGSDRRRVHHPERSVRDLVGRRTPPAARTPLRHPVASPFSRCVEVRWRRRPPRRLPEPPPRPHLPRIGWEPTQGIRLVFPWRGGPGRASFGFLSCCRGSCCRRFASSPPPPIGWCCHGYISLGRWDDSCSRTRLWSVGPCMPPRFGRGGPLIGWPASQVAPPNRTRRSCRATISALVRRVLSSAQQVISLPSSWSSCSGVSTPRARAWPTTANASDGGSRPSCASVPREDFQSRSSRSGVRSAVRQHRRSTGRQDRPVGGSAPAGQRTGAPPAARAPCAAGRMEPG